MAYFIQYRHKFGARCCSSWKHLSKEKYVKPELAFQYLRGEAVGDQHCRNSNNFTVGSIYEDNGTVIYIACWEYRVVSDDKEYEANSHSPWKLGLL